jgi:DNA-binding PadR family transcriptional regulator
LVGPWDLTRCRTVLNRVALGSGHVVGDREEHRVGVLLYRCSGADSSPIYTADMMKRTMQEATFLILTALAAGSQHGYGIISDVAKISDGRVRLRAGTLYSALDRLRLDGLINVDREEIVENRLRRYYRLTPEGFKQLATEAARFQSNAATAIARLGLAGRMAR